MQQDEVFLHEMVLNFHHPSNQSKTFSTIDYTLNTVYLLLKLFHFICIDEYSIAMWRETRRSSEGRRIDHSSQWI